MNLLVAEKYSPEKKYTKKEFKKIFYPNSSKEKIEQIQDPKEFADKLAEKSFEKIKKQLEE